MRPALPPREELLQIIREVRTRWRWKVALRSLTVLVGAGVEVGSVWVFLAIVHSSI